MGVRLGGRKLHSTDESLPTACNLQLQQKAGGRVLHVSADDPSHWFHSIEIATFVCTIL